MNSLKPCFCLFLIFSCGILSSAYAAPVDSRDSNSLLDQYIAVNMSELKFMESQIAIEHWKLARWQNLKAKGFASWLEVRRYQAGFRTLQQKQRAIAAFDAFLNDVAEQAKSHPSSAFHSNHVGVRASLPGSLRTIGWIEGFPMDRKSFTDQLDIVEIELGRFERAEENARRKMKDAPTDSSQRELLTLKWNSTNARKQWATAKLRYLTSCLSIQTTAPYPVENSQLTTIGVSPQTIRPQDDSALEQATWHIARAEAEARGSIDCVDRQLKRLAQRRAALTMLHADGNASSMELEHVEIEIQKHQEQHKQLTTQNQALKEAWAFIEADSPNKSPTIDSVPKYRSVSDWPVQVFQNQDAMRYLIDRRRSYFERDAEFQHFDQQVQMLTDLTERLKLALQSAQKTNVENDRFTRLLTKGQHKEIESYAGKLADYRLRQGAIGEEQAILILEENRYIEQLRSPSPAEMDLALASTGALALATLVTSRPSHAGLTRKPTIHYRYLESERWAQSSNLVFESTPHLPLNPFAYSVRGVQPSALIHHRRPLSFGPSGPIFHGHSSSLSGRGRRTSFSEIEFAAPSLFNSPYATNHYRLNQLQQPSPTVRNAYPFGILRSDLQRFSNASQPPWLLPGSPNNLRASQLHSGYRSPGKGTTGKPKSRNDVAPYRLSW